MSDHRPAFMGVEACTTISPDFCEAQIWGIVRILPTELHPQLLTSFYNVSALSGQTHYNISQGLSLI